MQGFFSNFGFSIILCFFLLNSNGIEAVYACKKNGADSGAASVFNV